MSLGRVLLISVQLIIMQNAHQPTKIINQYEVSYFDHQTDHTSNRPITLTTCRLVPKVFLFRNFRGTGSDQFRYYDSTYDNWHPEYIFRMNSSGHSVYENSLGDVEPRHIVEPPSYRDLNHAQKAFEVFNSMRRRNVFCDVILVANGVDVPAHRVILAGCSPYFQAMLTNFGEKTQDRIEIKEMDASVLKSFVEYVYTGEISITNENVQTLYLAADFLHFPAVVDACCTFIQSQLNLSNCFSVHAFANQHEFSNLLRATEAYFLENFSVVGKEKEFLALPAHQIIQIVKSDSLNVDGEEEVFECVMNWVQQDVENRRDDLPSLMEHVRYPLISRKYLSGELDIEQLLQINSQCCKYVQEAYKFHLSKPDERAAIQTPRTKLRHRNKVYVVGGIDGSSRTNAVYVYDILCNQWSTGISMNNERSSVSVAVLDNKIYAIGGTGVHRGAVDNVEVFDAKTEQWSPVASLLTGRSASGIGVLDDRIYIVGGAVGGESSSTVEYYNPGTNTWHKVSNMLYRRYLLSVGVIDGILYAVGGYENDGMVLNKVEAYDPKINIWNEVAPMNFCRHNAGIVSFNGLLYVMGGSDNTGGHLSSVEIYSPQNNTWTILPECMNGEHEAIRAVLINNPPEL